MCLALNYISMKQILASFVYRVRVMEFNTTFNNITVIVAVSFNLLVEETAVPEKNYRPVASNGQTSSHV